MTEFEWPWEYNFPPFFTLQVHEETRNKQITRWVDLVLQYQKHSNGLIMNINDTGPLFANEKIQRKLSPEAREKVFEKLQSLGYATPTDKRKITWEVYWHTLDEWAAMIYDWAVETAQTNSVCTLYEIANGDNSTGREFYQLDEQVILKALEKLQEQGKCEVFALDDSQGVKFY